MTAQPVTTAYIHVPFCKSKCFYCDFNSFSGREDRIEAYFDALIKEIDIVTSFYTENTADDLCRLPLKNIYIGGGTPSYVPPEYISRVLEVLRSRFGISKDAEITIECNPGTVDLNKFNVYKDSGVNRLSIGLQSASDTLLKKLGRIHSANDFDQCIEYADTAGLTDRNADLMLGLPGQTMEDFSETIKHVLGKKITHVSIYSLILEKGTPFYDKYISCAELLPSEELERDMYWMGVEEFKKNGFMHYEISNLAKKGYSCRQNITYWETGEYLGFGAGAHSYQQRIRYGNESGIDQYIQKINSSEGPAISPAMAEKDVLTPAGREAEFFMLGFRLLEGIDIRRFRKIFDKGIDSYLPVLEKLTRQGLIIYDGKRYKLTRHGIDFANMVFMEFV